MVAGWLIGVRILGQGLKWVGPKVVGGQYEGLDLWFFNMEDLGDRTGSKSGTREIFVIWEREKLKAKGEGIELKSARLAVMNQYFDELGFFQSVHCDYCKLAARRNYSTENHCDSPQSEI